MALTQKKKIEIIIPNPMIQLVVQRLDQLGAHRYTLVDAIAGRGHSGGWDSTHLTDATRHSMIMVVVSEDLVEPIVTEIGKLFDDYHGIFYVSDVNVLRADYF